MSEPMKVRARVSAPVKAVHDALTDAGALRTWLAEHAEVDLPQRFEFWGRYTPEGAAPHQRLLHVDDHTVRFSWLLDGEETSVEISLEEESADSTIIAVSQSHIPDWADVIAETSIRGVLHTYWALSIANLVDHLEGRELTPKCDFTSAEMRASVLVAASASEIYQSMIDPAVFRRWFGANVDIEPWVGGRFAMGGFENNPSPAKIVELIPEQKMTMSFGGLVAGWELAESAGKTRLTFVQSGFDPTNPPYGAWMGWLSGVAELRRFHELDDWRAIWVQVEMPGMPDGVLATD